MTDPTFTTPYAKSPGSSTPGPGVSPEQGHHELWGFFWLTLADTAIIVVAGFVAWLYINHAL